MTKQEEWLKALNVKPFYYYLEKEITVCLLVKNGKVVARGIAVCSPSDQFVKKTGRAKALGMALRAAINKENNQIIKPRRFILYQPIHPLFKAEIFVYRSYYLPSLTEFEKKLLNKVVTL